MTEEMDEIKKRIEIIEKKVDNLAETVRYIESSKYKNFNEAMNHIESCKIVPLSELRGKFPSISNTQMLSKFNKIFSDKIAIFIIDKKGHPRFYVHCKRLKYDFLHEFSLLWNSTLGFAQNEILVSDIKKKCVINDKEMEEIKNFVEAHMNQFAYFENDKLKRK